MKRMNSEILRDERRKRFLSRAKAAYQIGITEPTYRRAEDGGVVQDRTANLICRKWKLDSEDAVIEADNAA